MYFYFTLYVRFEKGLANAEPLEVTGPFNELIK